MGEFVGVEVDGVRQLRRIAIKVAGPDAKKALRTGHKETAGLVAPTAKRNAPKRTGNLANNVRPLGTVTKAQVAVGGSKAPYAGPIHGGWPERNIEPNPFITDAVSEEWTEIYAAFEDLYYGIAKQLETGTF